MIEETGASINTGHIRGKTGVSVTTRGKTCARAGVTTRGRTGVSATTRGKRGAGVTTSGNNGTDVTNNSTINCEGMM